MRAAHTLGLSRRARRRLLAALLVAAIAALAWDAAALWRAREGNRVIAQQRALAVAGGKSGQAVDALPAELRFAVASELAAGGNEAAALDGWRALQ